MTDPEAQTRPEFLSLVSYPTLNALLDSILAQWRSKRGFALATLNLDHIVKMRDDPDFLKAYEAHSHIVADGNPIVWLSRLAGRPIELVPGSDLITPLLQLAADNGVSVALFGATQETLDVARARLESAHSGLRIVSAIAPPFGFNPAGEEAVSYLKTIHASGAQLCLLALGAPKQEIFAAYGMEVAPMCGFVSIGAGLDFISGRQTRAPRWVRKLALEWLWRMLSNPRRLSVRYGRCMLVMPELTWQALRVRLAR